MKKMGSPVDPSLQDEKDLTQKRVIDILPASCIITSPYASNLSYGWRPLTHIYLQIEALKARCVEVDAEVENRKRVITQLVIDCQVCMSRMHRMTYPSPRTSHSSSLSTSATNTYIQSLMRELKSETSSPFDQQILGSVAHTSCPSNSTQSPASSSSSAAAGASTLTSLDPSPACVGIHVDMVQKLSDRANGLMHEKVRTVFNMVKRTVV